MCCIVRSSLSYYLRRMLLIIVIVSLRLSKMTTHGVLLLHRYYLCYYIARDLFLVIQFSSKEQLDNLITFIDTEMTIKFSPGSTCSKIARCDKVSVHVLQGKRKQQNVLKATTAKRSPWNTVGWYTSGFPSRKKFHLNRQRQVIECLHLSTVSGMWYCFTHD